MDDIFTYRIELQGLVEAGEIVSGAPIEISLKRVEAGFYTVVITQIQVRTDQSGLIGLMRYLHGKGMVLLSVIRESEK